MTIELAYGRRFAEKQTSLYQALFPILRINGKLTRDQTLDMLACFSKELRDSAMRELLGDAVFSENVEVLSTSEGSKGKEVYWVSYGGETHCVNDDMQDTLRFLRAFYG